MYVPEPIPRPDVPTLGPEPAAAAGLKGYKASTFRGLSAGINTATLSESLQNNVTMGGCYADGSGHAWDSPGRSLLAREWVEFVLTSALC